MEELQNCINCGKPFIQKRKDNITCSKSCSQQLWVKNNPEKNKERYNGEEAKKRKKEWIKNNYQKFRDIQNRYKRKRFRNDVNYKLNRLMGNAINQGVNDKGFKKWESIVGYSINTLKDHLLKFASDGFTWEIYLKGGYHIDHIIPQSMYNFKSYQDPEFKKCWHYRNLRVLSGDDNLHKLATYDPNLVVQYNIFDLLPKNIFNIM